MCLLYSFQIDCGVTGDNMDKQLVRYQRKRKDRVVQPFQGHLTEYIHSQEAAAMIPESGPGEPLLSPYVSNYSFGRPDSMGDQMNV